MKNFESKLLLVIGFTIVVFGLAACGHNDGIVSVAGKNGVDGNSCSAKVVNGQNEVVCTDGTSFPVSNGANGQNGFSLGSLASNATVSQCGNGGQLIEFYQDVNYSGSYASNDPITSQVLVCNGLNGNTGATGAAGTSSSVTVSAATLTQCATGGLQITTLNGLVSSTNVVCNGAVGPTGAQGPTGLTGATGAQGATGNTGATGAQGAAGISPNLSVVQFCPSSQVTSYPSTFSEVGVCLNNVMYGVYSANGGFLSMLPPGTYSSDGINSSCTFTIGANCSVSH